MVHALMLVARLTLAGDCAFADADIAPQLDPKKLGAGMKLTQSERKDRDWLETLQLPGGGAVMTQVGGCAHIAFQFSLRSKEVTAKLTADQAAVLMVRTLRGLPMSARAADRVRILIDALEKARKVDALALPASLPCGDARCALAIDLSKPAPALTVSYDFAL